MGTATTTAAIEPEKEFSSVAQEGVLTPTEDGSSTSEEPYSIYTRRQKWFIVGIVAVAGFHRCVVKVRG